MTTDSKSVVDDEAVLAYLRRMGYRQAERLLLVEKQMAVSVDAVEMGMHARADACVNNYVLVAPNGSESATPQNVMEDSERAFEAFAKWAHGSLDAYRAQLTAVLYPVAVHILLEMVVRGVPADRRSNFATRALDIACDIEASPAQRSEMQRLASLPDASHIRENALAVAFRTYKYNLSMSAAAYALLMAYLQDAAAIGVASASTPSTMGAMVILKVVNQFLNIRIVSDAPENSSAGASDGLTGISADAASAINRSDVKWGVHAIDPDVDAALALRARAEGTRVTDLIHGPLAMLKRAHTQSSVHAPAERLPRPPAGAAETSAELERLRSLSRRAMLAASLPSTSNAPSRGSLPSICMYTLQNAHDRATSVDFSATGTVLATGTSDSYIDVWALDHNRVRALLPSTDLAAMDIDDFKSLEPFREREGAPTRRLVGHGGPVYAVRFAHPDGHRLLISGSGDGTARLWSLDTLTCVSVFRGHTLPVWDVDVAPLGCGPYFATASADKTARLWSTMGGFGCPSTAPSGTKAMPQPLRILVGHLSDVDVVRFHPNGNYLFTGSTDRTVRMWDLQTGTCVRVFAGHPAPISAMRVSPDGRFLISGDRAGNLSIWDIADGRLVVKIPPTSKSPNAFVTSIDFDRDGRLLVSGGLDGVVNVWDSAKALSFDSASQTDPHSLLVTSYPTRKSALLRLYFTSRNILLAAGIYRAE